MAAGTLERLSAAVGTALNELAPLIAPEHAVVFFEQLGTRFPDSLETDAQVSPKLSIASTACANFGPLLDAFRTAEQAGNPLAIVAAAKDLADQVSLLVTGLGEVITAILGKADQWEPLTVSQVQAFADNFASNVIQDAVIRRVERSNPGLAAAAIALGVSDRFQAPVVGAGAEEPTGFTRRLHLDALVDALSDTASHFRSLVDWGTSPLDPTRILQRLEALLRLFTADTTIDTSSGSPELVTSLMTIERAQSAQNGLDFFVNLSAPDGVDLSIPIGGGFSVTATTTGELPFGTTLTVVPPSGLSVAAPVSFTLRSALVREPVAPDTAIVLIGQTGATRLEAQSIAFSVGIELGSSGGGSTGDVLARFDLTGGKAVIDFGNGDGFLKSLLPGSKLEAEFQLAATYDLSSGLKFEGGATLEVRIPLHVSFGGIEVNGLLLALPIGQAGRSGLPIDLATSLTTTFGPFTMVVDGVGLELDLILGSGSLVIGDVALRPKFPTGIGISIDGGGISGGGFLSHDPVTGRYAGALELRVFMVAVKAFGVLDTRFPDGTEGMSFVVLISAEFTPIQLGFGFTLVGVGGLLGINRSVAAEALGNAVRTGALAHLLFPRNPVQDAPAIINDLATVFPATRDRQLFGPMAKLGWGTPTLITADIGIVIEFPGPRLALLGVVRMVLPSAEFPLMAINCAVAGLLDFPAGKMSIDASLFDSRVAGYVVSGDMAYRLETGDAPSFLLSVGGFNPGFDAPARFPDLRRASVDLGVSGNPRLTASGYFAITSNSAQFGGRVDLNFRAGGFRVDGHFGFDTLFVFSPFRFTASISAGIHVSYEGVGFGVTLHGDLKGPTPWEFTGRVCVDLLLDEVCLRMSFTFGRSAPAALPEMDPWTGNQGLQVDPRVQVVGLRSAVIDPRNWEGEEPVDGYRVVSLSQAATASRTPIDPVGPATLRQKVCPLNQELEKFGEYRPITHTHFDVSSVTLAGQEVPFDTVDDKFAPAQFRDLKKSEKLSSRSYDDMVSGVTIAPNRAAAGPVGDHTVAFETVFITADGERIEEGDTDPRHTPSGPEFRGMLKRSAAALAGVRRAGAQKYMLPGKPKLLSFGKPKFVVASACGLTWNTSITPDQTTYTKAALALRNYEQTHPADRNRFRVVPFHVAA